MDEVLSSTWSAVPFTNPPLDDVSPTTKIVLPSGLRATPSTVSAPAPPISVAQASVPSFPSRATKPSTPPPNDVSNPPETHDASPALATVPQTRNPFTSPFES